VARRWGRCEAIELEKTMEHISSVMVPLIFFGFLAAVILVPGYLRSKDRERMHETLRIAYEKGQPVPPELIAALQSNPPPTVQTTPERDLRRAIVLCAVGLGFCGLGYGLWYGLVSGGHEVGGYIAGPIVAGVGAIPGMIGVAYLILWLGKRNAPKS
jgi:hypothetical protein